MFMSSMLLRCQAEICADICVGDAFPADPYLLVETCSCSFASSLAKCVPAVVEGDDAAFVP